MRKGNTWYVVVEIPKPLRHLIASGNNRRFVASLKTDSLARANVLKHAHVDAFKRRIEALKRGQTDQTALVVQKALEFRAARATADNEWLSTVGLDGMGDHESTADAELVEVINQEAETVLETHGPEASRLFHSVALGRATLISDHYENWLSHRTVTEQTRDQQRASVKLYLAWAGEHMTIEGTNRRKAGEYVQHLQTGQGFQRQTVSRHLSALSMFWKWLISRGLASLDPRDNPWVAHDLGRRKKAPYRRRLTDDELLTLLNSDIGKTRYKTVLYDLIRLGLLTGARIGALCAIKSSDVRKAADGYWLHVVKDKTEAGTRRIPFHSAGDSIITRRLADGDEFLFKGLKTGGRDGKRSHYVSRQYGQFRRRVGVKERGEDFHAFRNTFLEHMEGLEVPLTTAKLIIGHERGDITYGRYSSGELVKLREAITKLDYGPAVMEAIRRPPAEA
ncbi:tyrosine-type recombinase/integrase [Bradyrhizobium diazoefficiens]|nr:hypothetical protein XF15B_05770 [Bradyrhizobium diazoefficiens]